MLIVFDHFDVKRRYIIIIIIIMWHNVQFQKISILPPWMVFLF